MLGVGVYVGVYVDVYDWMCMWVWMWVWCYSFLFISNCNFSDDPSTVAMVKSVVESVYGDPQPLQRVLSNIGQLHEKVGGVCTLPGLPCYHGYF